MSSQQYCLLLSLENDKALIEEYERYHQAGAVWPEVVDSIRDSGIQSMRIYRLGTKLVMIVEADENFSFEEKAAADRDNPKVQEWERLMERFQKVDALRPDEGKWQMANRIFDLAEQ